MKKFILLVALGWAVPAFAQSTLVVTSSNYPSYPVGSTNVPISLDSSGRVILSAGSGVAGLPVPKKPVMIAKKPAPPKSIWLRLIVSLIFP